MTRLALAGALLALSAAGAAAAATTATTPAQAQLAQAQLAQGLTTEQVVGTVITAIERRIFEDYYHRAPPPRDKGAKKPGKGLPPGLAKKDRLPPGLAKRGQLPPGLAKRELPPDLYRRLPPRAHGRFYIVDDRIVLIDAATNVVLDLLEDLVAGH